jgi:hypothetical protein
MTMAKMMDIRKKITATLDQKPGDTFSISAIARAIGATPKATSAALGKLYNKGLVARPQKGLYSSKGSPPKTTAASEPAKPRKIAKAPKTVDSAPSPATRLSLITIDLLVEGEQSTIDAGGFLGKLLENKAVLDARVRKIAEADQSKLQVRFLIAD